MDSICNKRKMRFYTYAIMITGMILVLNLAGITTPVGGSILGWLNIIDSSGLNLSSLKLSDGWNELTSLLTGLVTAGVVLGAFGRAPDIRYVTAAIVFLLTGLIMADLIAIFTIIQGFSSFGGIFKSIFGIILSGGAIGLFITAIQFWQSPD